MQIGQKNGLRRQLRLDSEVYPECSKGVTDALSRKILDCLVRIKSGHVTTTVEKDPTMTEESQ